MAAGSSSATGGPSASSSRSRGRRARARCCGRATSRPTRERATRGSQRRSARRGSTRCRAAATTASTSRGRARATAVRSASSRRSGACGARSSGAPCTALRPSCPPCRAACARAGCRRWRRSAPARTCPSRPSRPARTRRAPRSRAGSTARIDRYAERHDTLAGGTAELSPYLRWGCLSPRECEERATAHGGRGAAAWVRQLCWRDFYAHVLLAHPESATQELQARYRGALEWDTDEERLAAWQARAHRLPARRRRHAPARAHGLDAQPRAARRRLVPDQGPAPRLASGRGVVRAAAAGRGALAEHRQLAVDRLGRGRSGAAVPADVQPGPPPGALRPRRRVRPPLGARAARRAARAPDRAVDDERRGAGGARAA